MRQIGAAVCALFFAVAAAAADVQLRVGPEMQIGGVDLGEWPYVDNLNAPALATNGDEVLAVLAAGNNSLYGMRLDREGRPLASVPKVLLEATEDFEVHFDNHVEVLWHHGVYVVFFLERFKGLHALRVTQDLEVLDLTPVAKEIDNSFDVATDGDDFVVVSKNASLLRLRPDFSVRQSVAFSVQSPLFARAVAFAGGRFAILTQTPIDMGLYFLDGGTLAPRRVLATVNNKSGGLLDLAWTGSELAAIWSECVEQECLVSRMRLAADGVPAGEMKPLTYLRLATTSNPLSVTVVSLGDETVLYRWDTAAFTGVGSTTSAWGRRFRRDVPLDPAPLDFGKPKLAAIRTAHDLLVTVDSVFRVSVTPAPATAPLSNPIPLAAATATSANELILAAAASATEIAVIRQQWRHIDRGRSSLIAAVHGRDGSLVREIALTGTRPAVATDGQRFFVTVTDSEGVVWFSELRDGAPRVAVGRDGYYYYSPPGLIWNGSELIVYRLWPPGSDPHARFQRINREGVLVGGPFAIGQTSYDASLIPRGEGLLLTWRNSNAWYARRLTPGGTPLDDPQLLSGLTDIPVAAWNGSVEAFLFPELIKFDSQRLRIALRTSGTSRVISDFVDPGGRYISGLAVAAAGDYFVGFYGSRIFGRGHPRTHAVLFDERGVLDAPTVAVGGSIDANPAALLPLGPREVLAVYSRKAYETPHAGASRVFARVLSIEPRVRRRAVR